MSLLHGPAGTIDITAWGEGKTSFTMLHASATGPRSLSGLAGCLSHAERRLVAPAFAGYGRTQLSCTDSLDRLADNRAIVRAVLQAQPAPRRVLIGHSMGGTVALTIALEEQRRGSPFDAVILYEPILVDLLNLAEPDQVKAREWDRDVIDYLERKVQDGEPEAGVRNFVEAWNETTWDALPEAARQTLVGNADNLVVETASVSAHKIDLSALEGFQTPTLLLRGSLSPALIAFTMDRAARLIPRVCLCVIDGCGHMGPILAPSEIADRIETFLGAIDGA